jgi:hypothetical protein
LLRVTNDSGNTESKDFLDEEAIRALCLASLALVISFFNLGDLSKIKCENNLSYFNLGKRGDAFGLLNDFSSFIGSKCCLS